MPADFHCVRYILPKFGNGRYYALMRSWANLNGYESDDVAQFRFAVLKHCYGFGWKAAVAAFKVPKSTLFDWKGVYEKSGKRLNALVPVSTRPKRTRVLLTDPRMVELIKSIRQEYGRVSKYKLKVFLDEYSKSLKIPGYGYQKIAKIIKRNHFFFDPPHKQKHRILKVRLKSHPKETLPGYLEMDSVTIYLSGKKLYFITIIDVVTRFAWVKLTFTLSSTQTKLALQEFGRQYSPGIRAVQTDNGHEFLAEFDQYLQNQQIPHQFIYLRSPKINGVVERFNRTIQDEFLSRSDEMYTQDWDKLNQRLSHYLIWYNTQRPHYSLNYMTPTQYLNQLHSEK
jgi:transposase InsO family protein